MKPNVRLVIMMVFLTLMLMHVQSGAVSYSYDSQNRITRVDYGNGVVEEYVYDLLGNRLGRSVAPPGGVIDSPPTAPGSPLPVSGATGVATAATLQWSGGDPDTGDRAAYTVMLGSSPSLLKPVWSGTSTSFTTAPLTSQTAYYWQVHSRDSHNRETAGPVWSFTTANNRPTVSAVPDQEPPYSTPLSVTLTPSRPATIYYTTNGTTPTPVSRVYSQPITLETTTTLKYFAVDTNGDQGAVQSTLYTLPGNTVLTVKRVGTGNGTVSQLYGPTIDCGALCSTSVPLDYEVSLQAQPVTGSAFTGWSGGCSGTGDCIITMNADTTVTATFSDQAPPLLTVSTLAGDRHTADELLNVAGKATDDGHIQAVTVNGAPAVVDTDGSFSHPLLLPVGATTLTVTATDGVGGTGHTTTFTRPITRDNIASGPLATFAIFEPADNGVTRSYYLPVSGTVGTGATVNISIDNGTPQPVTVDDSGDFSQWVELVDYGLHTIEVTASATGGATTTIKRTVNYSQTAFSDLTITSPLQDSITNQPTFVLMGFTGSSYNKVTLELDGLTYRPVVQPEGNFEQVLTLDGAGTHRIMARIANNVSNEVKVVRNIHLRTAGIAVTSPAESFGVVGLGTSATRPFIIRNNGNEPLVISAIVIEGSNPSAFSRAAGACPSLTPTIAPGVSCALDVTFTAASTGEKSALLTISSNDPVNPQLKVSLWGTTEAHSLTIKLAGSGGGSVNTDPAGIACTAPSCAGSFPSFTQFSLLATPDANSVFSGWSGGCTGLAGCTLALHGDTTVTASFTAAQTVRLDVAPPVYFDSLALAYAMSPEGSPVTLRSRGVTFLEDLLLTRPIPLTIRGGYDTGFGTVSGRTILRGKLTIRNGTLRSNAFFIR